MINSIIAPVMWTQRNLKQSPTRGSLMTIGVDLNIPVANNVYVYSRAISGFAPLTDLQTTIPPPTTIADAVEYYRRLTNLFASSSYSIPFSTPQFMTVAPSGQQGIFWITSGSVATGDWSVDEFGVPTGSYSPTDTSNPFSLDQVVLGRYFRFDVAGLNNVTVSTDTALTYSSHDFPSSPGSWGTNTWQGAIPCFCAESGGGWHQDGILLGEGHWEGWNPNEDYPPSVEISFSRSNPIDMVARFEAARAVCVSKTWLKNSANCWSRINQNRLSTLNGSSPTPTVPASGWGTYVEITDNSHLWPLGYMVDPGYTAAAGWGIFADELSNCIIRWQKGFVWHTKDARVGHSSMQPYFVVLVKVFLHDTTEVTVVRQGTIQGGSLNTRQKVIGYGADESTGNVALQMPDAPTLPLPTGPNGGPLVACYYQAVIGIDPTLWALRNGYVLRWD
jgi:hypothetical protein